MRLLVIFLTYGLLLTLAYARAGYRDHPPRRSGRAGGACSRILVVGATGGTGRQLVSQALERGLIVTALVRNPGKLELRHPNLTIVQGDVLDSASVSAAVRGQDAVVSALGHRRYLGPSRILSEGTRNLLRAMEENGVPRFICETSLGIGNGAGRMGLYYTFFVLPAILPFYFWDKTVQERLVAASEVDWVLVRPAALTHSPPRGSVRHGRNVGDYIRTLAVPRADVARFMLDQLVSDTYLRRAVGVC